MNNKTARNIINGIVSAHWVRDYLINDTSIADKGCDEIISQLETDFKSRAIEAMHDLRMKLGHEPSFNQVRRIIEKL